jgi:hypothetical protein
LKKQDGYIYEKNEKWKLRYYDNVLQPDGTVRRMQLSTTLADRCDAYRTKRSVRPLADDFLRPINSGKLNVRSTMPVAQFIETVYLPEIEEQVRARVKRASTLKDYKDIFRLHVKGRLGQISLRDFRTVTGEELLKTIARQAKTKNGDPLRRSTLAN